MAQKKKKLFKLLEWCFYAVYRLCADGMCFSLIGVHMSHLFLALLSVAHLVWFLDSPHHSKVQDKKC